MYVTVERRVNISVSDPNLTGSADQGMSKFAPKKEKIKKLDPVWIRIQQQAVSGSGFNNRLDTDSANTYLDPDPASVKTDPNTGD